MFLEGNKDGVCKLNLLWEILGTFSNVIMHYQYLHGHFLL